MELPVPGPRGGEDPTTAGSPIAPAARSGIPLLYRAQHSRAAALAQPLKHSWAQGQPRAFTWVKL